MDNFQYIAILPEIGLTVMAMVALFMDVYLPNGQRRSIAIVSFIGLMILSIVPLIFPPIDSSATYWGGMIRYDALAQMFKVMVIMAGAISCLLAIDTKSLGERGEYYLIVIVATLGATLVASAADMIMLFVALETISIPLYILAAFRRDDQRSSESGMKYFLFGSFSSAVMMYGLSFIYGFSNETNLYAIAQWLGGEAFSTNPVPVLAAMVMVFVGFGFKVSAVPFHFWTPDVYEGAPTPVTAFVSVASKAASFAILVRFFLAVFPESLMIGGISIQAYWAPMMAILATLTMTIGNVLALWQSNIKRMLAYSSVAQAGYVLIGIAAIQSQTELGVASVAFYLFMYTFTNLLSFAVVILFSEATGSESIKDFAGLSRRSPALAITMTIAFLSLAGLPPTAGFIGKFFLFNAAVEAGLTWLAVVGVLNSLVALYYYLVVVKIIYVDRSEDADKPIAVSNPYRWVLAITTIAVIALGTFAVSPVFNWARESARSLFV